MVTRQCIVLHPWLWRCISRWFTSNLLLLLLLLLGSLPLLLGPTHLVLQLLDLAHLGVDQQVIGRLLLLRELHHRKETWFLFHFCVSAGSGRSKQAGPNRSRQQAALSPRQVEKAGGTHQLEQSDPRAVQCVAFSVLSNRRCAGSQ